MRSRSRGKAACGSLPSGRVGGRSCRSSRLRRAVPPVQEVSAAEPSAYLPADTKWVVVADIDAILNSPVIKAKGIDLNALFQAAVADEDTKIISL